MFRKDDFECRERRHHQATPEGEVMQRTHNKGCADEMHFVQRQRSDWNPYKRKDLKYERNLRDESGISALTHKSKAWCLMCSCRNRTRDAEAGRQKQADSPLGHHWLTIISKQEATNLTTMSGLQSGPQMASLASPLSMHPGGHDKAALQCDWIVRPQQSCKQNHERLIDLFIPVLTYFHQRVLRSWYFIKRLIRGKKKKKKRFYNNGNFFLLHCASDIWRLPSAWRHRQSTSTLWGCAQRHFNLRHVFEKQYMKILAIFLGQAFNISFAPCYNSITNCHCCKQQGISVCTAA